jgi:hypothetical protein
VNGSAGTLVMKTLLYCVRGREGVAPDEFKAGGRLDIGHHMTLTSNAGLA